MLFFYIYYVFLVVHLNPLPTNGPSTPGNGPNKVDGPRIRAGTALPNRGSPTPMLTVNANTGTSTTPTRPNLHPVGKTEEAPSTPPIKTSNSDESIGPSKPANGPPALVNNTRYIHYLHFIAKIQSCKGIVTTNSHYSKEQRTSTCSTYNNPSFDTSSCHSYFSDKSHR